MFQGSIVRKSSFNFWSFTSLRNSNVVRRCFVQFLLLLLFLGLVGGSAAANADVRKAHVSSGGPGLPFAIADFDGDLRPDLASVQTGKSFPSATIP